MSIINKFGLVFALSVFIFFTLVLTQESSLKISLDYGGIVYGEKNVFWGLKTYTYEFKVLDGEWYIRKRGYSYIFSSFKPEYNDWYEFQIEPIDYPDE